VDELDPVEQQFVADVTEYLAAMDEAAASAQEFAGANEEVTVAFDSVRDHAAEAGAALDVYQDAAGRWRNSAGQFATSAELEAAALGRERDEALEAELAMRRLADAEVEAGAAGAAESAGGLSMMAVGMTALIGLAAALAPALLAVGGAIGAFALFAIPTVKAVTGALGDTQAQLAKLPPPIQMVVAEIKNVKSEWGELSKQFQLPVANLMSQGLGIVSDLLPKLVPLANAGFAAVSQILDAVGRFTGSSTFTDFLDLLTSLAGPATTALLGLAQTVGGILLGALTQLAPYSVPLIDMLKSLLAAAGPGLISALKLIAETLLDVGRAVVPLIGPLSTVLGYMAQHPIFAQMAAAILGIVAAVKLWAIAQGILDAVLTANPIGLVIAAIALLVVGIVELVKHWSTVSAAFATAGHAIASAFDTVRHTVASWGHDVANTFDTVRHTVAGIGDAIAKPFEIAFNWLKQNWKLLLSILLDPIGTAVMEIKDHTHQIAQAFDQVRHDVAAIFDGWVHDMEHSWDTIRHDIAAIADWIPAEISSLWSKAVALNVKALEILEHDVATAFDTVRHSVAAGIDDVLAFFQKLPGQVVSFLASLPGQMLSIGENVIKGLINGILNAAAQIPSIMGSLASDVASYFTDPLKLFSPSRLFFDHGFNIVQGAINGVKANAPALLATMRGLGAGVAVAGTGSSLAAGAIAPAGGSTSVHVTVPTTVQGSVSPAYADPRFQQYMQQQVQEAVLRYAQINPNNGLTSAWGR